MEKKPLKRFFEKEKTSEYVYLDKLFILNSLPNDKMLPFTRLKAFANEKFNAPKLIISVFNREEILWERR